MNDGPSKSSRACGEIEGELDSFEESLGLPKKFSFAANTAIALLDLPAERMRAMDAESCAEAGVLLKQFSFHLQRAMNRETARVKWAEERLKRTIAKILPGMKGLSFEERKLSAVASDPDASEFDAVRVKAALRVDRLSYLAGKCDGLAQAFSDLRFAKQKRD